MVVGIAVPAVYVARAAAVMGWSLGRGQVAEGEGEGQGMPAVSGMEIVAGRTAVAAGLVAEGRRLLEVAVAEDIAEGIACLEVVVLQETAACRAAAAGCGRMLAEGTAAAVWMAECKDQAGNWLHTAVTLLNC